MCGIYDPSEIGAGRFRIELVESLVGFFDKAVVERVRDENVVRGDTGLACIEEFAGNDSVDGGSEGASSATQAASPPRAKKQKQDKPALPEVYAYPLKNKDAKHVQTWVHDGCVFIAEH